MPSLLFLLFTCFLYIKGGHGQITLTQTPNIISVPLDGAVKIVCESSTSLFYSGISKHELNWFQQKVGQKPKLIISYATERLEDVPTRFSGSVSGLNYTLSIQRVQQEDEAEYFCLQYFKYPALTVI
ncbi:hypothetical protein GDO81_000034 [Engystomops pustulosus]|uniref:Ig-like domain-containing protein n=1 Tax=Engystomops pustulosus TaxID=76066 RepID=A0AAV7D114_ENGPU|nr:hypothetical protein GDO81_000034 [Engystomops pustulosus]